VIPSRRSLLWIVHKERFYSNGDAPTVTVHDFAAEAGRPEYNVGTAMPAMVRSALPGGGTYLFKYSGLGIDPVSYLFVFRVENPIGSSSSSSPNFTSEFVRIGVIDDTVSTPFRNLPDAKQPDVSSLFEVNDNRALDQSGYEIRFGRSSQWRRMDHRRLFIGSRCMLMESILLFWQTMERLVARTLHLNPTTAQPSHKPSVVPSLSTTLSPTAEPTTSEPTTEQPSEEPTTMMMSMSMWIRELNSILELGDVPEKLAKSDEGAKSNIRRSRDSILQERKRQLR